MGRSVMKETHPFNRPAEDGCLEVFGLGKLATLDRVDDAQPPVKFTTWDIQLYCSLYSIEGFDNCPWNPVNVDNGNHNGPRSVKTVRYHLLSM